MRRTAKACLGAWILLTIIAFDTGAWDKPQINWQQDPNKAIAEAQSLSRPMLLYFSAKWCPSCLRVERTVFVDKRVVQFISENFVAVRIDADTAPELAEIWKVDRLPSAVLVSADARAQNKIEGYKPADQYLSELSSFVKATQPGRSAMLEHSSGVRPANHASADRGQAPTANDERIELAARRVDQSTSGVQAVTLSLQEEPDLAFDGTCVVSMLDSRKIVCGDPLFSANVDGATYWLAGSEELEKFEADPERYIPMASGLCVVSLVDDGAKIRGNMHCAAIYRNRLFLFANAELRQRFQVNAKRYYDLVLDNTNK